MLVENPFLTDMHRDRRFGWTSQVRGQKLSLIQHIVYVVSRKSVNKNVPILRGWEKFRPLYVFPQDTFQKRV
jgi:hypothetical protein